jgi:excisionase family DNA binding protein
MTTSVDTPEDVLTTSEVAQALRVSPMTVRRWIDAGDLPAFTQGRVRRVLRTDLDSFINAARISRPLTETTQR